MLDELDEAIEKMLKHGLPNELASVSISFLPPDKDFPPSSAPAPALNLFLYDIHENLELRTSDYYGTASHKIVERGTPKRKMAQVRPMPVYVQCSYMVTAWPGTGTANPAKDEHRLLGAAMRALMRYRSIPDTFLDKAQSFVPSLSLPIQPGTLRVGEFWQAMGAKPRAAFDYHITISFEPTEPYEVRVVETVPVKIFGPGTIRGKITNENDAPLRNVKVKEQESGKTATTDDQGRYIMKGLDIKACTVVFSITGYKKAKRQVELAPNKAEMAEINVRLERP
ncbi:MAG: DUF4255 domain-containing protein [Deltaproteobacteria bacterium]|nr:DUF4255 domain-containing protein [Deltaproteobacteria bacterium]